uniref:Uncharacterized protein n=1 Tax=Haptolina ericina TaxID=156174 RepID=A0A7S3AR41_9EUKA
MGKARGWASSRGEELEPLLEHTDLISVRWLRDLAAERRIIPAWQKLPTEAKAELKDMREWRGDGLPIGVLSYGWGGPDHPDPAGLQLQALLPVLSAIVTVCDTFSKNCTWGIFWDFPCLPQRGHTTGGGGEDRTQEQLERYGSAFRMIDCWYAHPHTYSMLLHGQMSELDGVAGYPIRRPCNQRGWCIAERALSALVKDDPLLLELGELNAPRDWADVLKQCKASRGPPLTPPAFEEMIRQGLAGGTLVFGVSGDVDLVIERYREGFVRAFTNCSFISFKSMRWGDDEVILLTQAMEYAHANGGLGKLARLGLSGNLIGDKGCTALAKAFTVSGAFKELLTVDLFSNKIGDAGGQALVEALDRQGVLPKFTGIQLELNQLSMEGFQAVESAAGRSWRRNHHHPRKLKL